MISGYGKQHCFTPFAIKNKDEKLCLNIIDDYGQFSCIGSISVKKKNPELCNTLKNEEYKNKFIQAVTDPTNQNARLGLFV